MEQNFFSIYQKTGLYTLTTSYSSPPDQSSVTLAMEMAKEAGFKVYTLAPDRKDGYPTLATSLESFPDYRQMDEHFSGMPSKALVYVPMEVNNKTYASNGRRSFPCAGVFALKKGAKGADILVNYSLDGGSSDGNFSYVAGAPGGPPKEERDGEEPGKRKRAIEDRIEKALKSLAPSLKPEQREPLAKCARGPFIERLRKEGVCSEITQDEIVVLLYMRGFHPFRVRNYRDCSNIFECANRSHRAPKWKRPLFLEGKKGTYEFRLNEKGKGLLLNRVPIDPQIREALCSCRRVTQPEGIPADILKDGRAICERLYRAEAGLSPLDAGKEANLISDANGWWGRYNAAKSPAENASPNVGDWAECSHLNDADKKDAKEIVAALLKLKASTPGYSGEAASVYQALYRSIVTNREACIPDECLTKAKSLLEKAKADGVDVALPERLRQHRPQQTELRFAEADSQSEGEAMGDSELERIERDVVALEKKARVLKCKANQAKLKDLERREKKAVESIKQSTELLRELGSEN